VPPTNRYRRLLTHHLAERFKLKHLVDRVSRTAVAAPNARAILIFRTDDTCMPLPLLSEMVRDMKRMRSVFGPRVPRRTCVNVTQPDERYRTRLCKNFAAGACIYGAMCHFAHGKEQLRSRVAGNAAVSGSEGLPGTSAAAPVAEPGALTAPSAPVATSAASTDPPGDSAAATGAQHAGVYMPPDVLAMRQEMERIHLEINQHFGPMGNRGSMGNMGLAPYAPVPLHGGMYGVFVPPRGTPVFPAGMVPMPVCFPGTDVGRWRGRGDAGWRGAGLRGGYRGGGAGPGGAGPGGAGRGARRGVARRLGEGGKAMDGTSGPSGTSGSSAGRKGGPRLGSTLLGSGVAATNIAAGEKTAKATGKGIESSTAVAATGSTRTREEGAPQPEGRAPPGKTKGGAQDS
jgi:hypothetical protein